MVTSIPVMVEKRDLKGLIFMWAVSVQDLGHPFLKLNISKYQEELVRLTNQVLDINSSWGELQTFIR